MSMIPGFDPNEAIDLIRLSYIATALDPQSVNPHLTDRDDPFSDHDIPATTIYPSPVQPIWPSNWGPLPKRRWHESIVCSVFPEKDDGGQRKLLKKFGVGNTALVTYNKTKNQYALAFAGTENLYGALEDMASVPVPAGQLDRENIRKALQPVFASTKLEADAQDKAVNLLALIVAGPHRYVPETYSRSEAAQIDLGFRLAFESLSSKATNGPLLSKTPSLMAVLDLIPEGSDLFISGHSLGGAIATVATAWFLAGNFPKRMNIKTYTFAAPKSGNEYYANALNGALARQGLFYRVYNDLDSIPQVPYSLEMPGEINNPGMLKAFTGLIPDPSLQQQLDKFLAAVLPSGWSLNYTHAGVPHALVGRAPIVFEPDNPQPDWPEKYFPNHDLPLPPFGYDPKHPHPTPEERAKEIDHLKQWWQHMPYVYLDLLHE